MDGWPGRAQGLFMVEREGWPLEQGLALGSSLSGVAALYVAGGRRAGGTATA